MLVFRLAQSAHIRDLTGAGARLYGGRWNHRGTAVIYASETRSLATLEYLVHVPLPHMPADLSIASLEIPDDVPFEEVNPSDLPQDWRRFPAPSELAGWGTAWARSCRGLLLRVPSAVVDHECNVLLNPSHPDVSRVAIADVKLYSLDERLFGRR